MRDSLNTRETLLGRLVDYYDEKSWHEFVNLYRQYIFHLIRKMNVSHHDAEELTQVILLKLWKKLPQFKYDRQQGRFRSWLSRIVCNQVRNFIRDRGKYYEKLNSAAEEAKSNMLARINFSEFDKIAQEEWEKYISVMAWENVRKHFSDKVCEAFLMLRRGASRKEVAEKLNLAESSVSTYKARIVERIKAEIERLDEELNGI